MLFENVVNYFMVGIYYFTVSVWLYHPLYIPSKTGKRTKELDWLKNSIMKIQDVTSNVAITEENEKKYGRLQLSIPGIQRSFLDKVTPDIDGFTAEPVFHQCKMFKF